MGFYIETGTALDKADILKQKHGAVEIPQPKRFSDIDPAYGLISVVSNGPFEAAGFCYDEREFDAFTNPSDHRPKIWLTMDRSKAEQLSGFKS